MIQGISGSAPIAPQAAPMGLAGMSSQPVTPQQPAPAAQNEAPESSDVRARLQSAIELLQGPLGQHFDDPAFRKAAETYDSFLNKGEKPAGVTKEGLYDFGNKLFTRELRDGVGGKLPDGSTITSKRLVAARPMGDDLVLELDVSAQRPDGKSYNYRAPVTKNRTHEDTDEVLRVPIDKVRDRIRGAKYMAQAVEQAGGRDVLLRQLMQSIPPDDMADAQPPRGLSGARTDMQQASVAGQQNGAAPANTDEQENI